MVGLVTVIKMPMIFLTVEVFFCGRASVSSSVLCSTLNADHTRDQEHCVGVFVHRVD